MASSLPLISVIIPVYNTGKTAAKLAKKLLSDKYNNLEIIIVDDGSIDDSLNVLKAIKSSKIILKSKKNGGASSARNLGIKIAKGKYILFLDSDDDIASDFISSLVKEKGKENVSLAVTGIYYKKLEKKLETTDGTKHLEIKKNEDVKTLVLRSLLLDGRMYAVFNKIFDAETIKNNDIAFDESLNFAEDTKFVLDYLSFAHGNIKFIEKPLYIYNYGTETSTVKKTGKVWNNWKKSFTNLKKWVGKTPTIKQKVLLQLIHLRWYISYLRSR